MEQVLPRTQLFAELSGPDFNAGRLREICMAEPGILSSYPSARIKVWSLLLLGKLDLFDGVCSPDGVNVPSVSLTLPYPCKEQQVLIADVLRTRADYDSFRSTEYRQSFTAVLQNFCLKHDIQYKQGMNEVLAPFFFLSPPPSSNFIPYTLFEAFLFRYLERYFCLDDSSYLFKSFRMFHTLLVFHDPQLALHLKSNHYPPEFYSPQWFLTLFARSLPLNQVLRLWDFVICVDDPAFPFFIGICLIRRIRSDLLRSDSEGIPEKLKKGLTFHGEGDIDFILLGALDLYRKTPRYFCRLLRMCCVSSPFLFSVSSSQREQELNARLGNASDFSNIDKALAKQVVRVCTMLSAQEVISTILSPLSHPSSASDQNNDDNNNGIGSSSSSSSGKSTEQLQQFIFIDIRSAQEITDSGGGSLPKAIQLEPDFVETDHLDIWLQHFDATKGAQICLIDLPPVRMSGIGLWRRLLFGEGDGFASSSVTLPTSSVTSAPNSSASRNPDSSADFEVIRDADSKFIELEDVCVQEDRVRPAAKLARALQKASFPYVTILDGGFPALVQALVASRGGVEPVLVGHDPVRWERYLKATGRTAYLPGVMSDSLNGVANINLRRNNNSKGESSAGSRDPDEADLTKLEQLVRALRVAQTYGHGTAARIISDKIEKLSPTK